VLGAEGKADRRSGVGYISLFALLRRHWTRALNGLRHVAIEWVLPGTAFGRKQQHTLPRKHVVRPPTPRRAEGVLDRQA